MHIIYGPFFLLNNPHLVRLHHSHPAHSPSSDPNCLAVRLEAGPLFRMGSAEMNGYRPSMEDTIRQTRHERPGAAQRGKVCRFVQHLVYASLWPCLTRREG